VAPRNSSVILVSVLALCRAAGISHAVLEISDNQRHLQDAATGTPFFLTGDAAWSLIAELPLEDAVAYLDDREAKGFNFLMVNLIEHEFASNAPLNYYGEAPFSGAPFSSPNESYFAHADQVVAAAETRGIVVLLDPVYLGYQCGSQGWCQEIAAATMSEMRNWGRYVGARYSAFDNIVWLIGGDADPTPVADKLREVVAGIREFDTVHLITAHNQPETEAVDPWLGDDWVEVNSVYTYSTVLYGRCRDAYARSPIVPYFLLESAYENEHSSTPQNLRAQSYWAALAGAFGHVFGNCPIWHFGSSSSWCGLTDWEGELDSPGSFSMQHYRRLFESRRWTELVPDLNSTVLVAGSGSYGSVTYATAASAADGSSIIAYLPTPRTVTIDPGALTGSEIRAWWYDPSDGSAAEIGVFPNQVQPFVAPSGDDWVLVVDDASIEFPPPGGDYDPTHVPESSALSTVRTMTISPNPSPGWATIELRLPDATDVDVRILTADGRLVRQLRSTSSGKEALRIGWDGRDEHGVPAPPGAYFVHAITPTMESHGKLILWR
jgi:hypothetical protein